MRRSQNIGIYVCITVVLFIIAAAVLFFMGRNPLCSCGYVKLWEGVPGNAGNSQHLLDFYTFSHIIHGFAFFAILWSSLKKRLSLGNIFLLAVIIEVIWEIIENTPWSINRYRNGTVSMEYVGDSIINSLSDISVMIAGFWFAYKMPWKITLVIFIIMEIGVGYAIRDGLILNIIMFLYPIEWIRNWQMGL